MDFKKILDFLGFGKKKVQEEKKDFVSEVLSFIRTIIGAIIVVMIINGIAVASFVVPTGSMENTVMTGDFLFVNKFKYGPTTPQVIPFINQPLPFYKFPGPSKPKLGDVIVFIYPGNRDEVVSPDFTYYLKRCCGTPGDTIQVINKQLFVNRVKIPLAPNGVYLWDRPNQPSDFPLGTNFTRDFYGPLRIPKKGDFIKLTPENILQWDVFISREGHKVEHFGNEITIDGKKADGYSVQRNYYFGMGDNRDNSADSREWGFIPEDNIIGTPMVVYWSWDTNMAFSDFFTKLTTVRWNRLGKIIL